MTGSDHRGSQPNDARTYVVRVRDTLKAIAMGLTVPAFLVFVLAGLQTTP